MKFFRRPRRVSSAERVPGRAVPYLTRGSRDRVVLPSPTSQLRVTGRDGVQLTSGFDTTGVVLTIQQAPDGTWWVRAPRPDPGVQVDGSIAGPEFVPVTDGARLRVFGLRSDPLILHLPEQPTYTAWEHGAASHAGPRSRNEDACAADGAVLAVADGVGGLPGGDIASAAVVGRVARLSGVDPALFAPMLAGVVDAAIAAAVVDEPGLAGMATTLTAAFAARPGPSGQVPVTLFHVGDTSAYVVAAGSAGAVPVTVPDHDPDEPTRLTACIGHGPVPAELTASCLLLWPGDTLVLASDGVTGVLHADGIASLVEGRHPRDAADRLVAAALDTGSADNVTAVVATVPRSGLPAPDGAAGPGEPAGHGRANEPRVP